MNCELTSTLAGSVDPTRNRRKGEIEPCGVAAWRRCPVTGKAVCNGHSRSDTSRDGLRAGRRRCSACGGEHDAKAWRLP